MQHWQSPSTAQLQLRSPAVHLAVFFLAIVYALYFSATTSIGHLQFHTFAYDLGTFDQGIWLAGHGTDWFVTVRGLNLLGDHVRLFSFLLAPLYWLWDDVRALLILQSVAIAAGAIFLYRIAERELPGRPWLVLAISAGYLLHPAVQNLNLDHAHPDAFATTFLLASVDFLRGGRLLPFWIAAALAMSCKEDVPLVFVMMGFVLMMDPRRRRLGIVLALVSSAYFLLCVAVILPHFNGVGFFRTKPRGFLAGFGRHGTEAAWLFGRLLRRESALYLWTLGVPHAFLFLLAPRWLLPAVPALAANLLSDANYMRSMYYHYHASIVPFLAIATIDALASLTRAGSVEAGAAILRSRRLRQALPAIVILGAALAANVTWSKIPLQRSGVLLDNWRYLQRSTNIAEYHRMLETIPRDASVAADYSLLPHLSHRRFVYMLPNPFRQSYWGIAGENQHDPRTVDYIAIHNVRTHDPVMQQVEKLAPGQFERIAGDLEYGVFRRKRVVAIGEHASCGDWDGDGRITREDLQWIADAIMKGGECPPRVCDADGDGTARSADVLRIGKRATDPAIALGCPD